MKTLLRSLLPSVCGAFAALALLAPAARADALDVAAACKAGLQQAAQVALDEVQTTADLAVRAIGEMQAAGAPPEAVAELARTARELIAARATLAVGLVERMGAACAQELVRMGASPELLSAFRRDVDAIAKLVKRGALAQMRRVEAALG